MEKYLLICWSSELCSKLLATNSFDRCGVKFNGGKGPDCIMALLTARDVWGKSGGAWVRAGRMCSDKKMNMSAVRSRSSATCRLISITLKSEKLCNLKFDLALKIWSISPHDEARRSRQHPQRTLLEIPLPNGRYDYEVGATYSFTSAQLQHALGPWDAHRSLWTQAT